MPAKDNTTKKVPSYRDRQRFPETNSSWKQLQYLLLGLMPLLHQKAHSAVHRLMSAFEVVLHFFRRATMPLPLPDRPVPHRQRGCGRVRRL